MVLANYQKLAYRWFKNFSEKHVGPKLIHDLEAAHKDIRAAVYLSVTILFTIIGLIVSFIVMALMVFLILPALGINLDLLMTIVFLLIPLIVAGGIYLISLMLPGSTAKARGKKIDLNLPYALNFVSAMSSAGVTPTEIFKSLSKQEIYGEIKEEASWIYRDVALLGTDILTSIKKNIDRTGLAHCK